MLQKTVWFLLFQTHFQTHFESDNDMNTKSIKFFSNVLAVVMVSALALGLSACQKEEGPAERAGKSLDNAVQKAGEKVEQAGEKIQDAAKEANK